MENIKVKHVFVSKTAGWETFLSGTTKTYWLRKYLQAICLHPVLLHSLSTEWHTSFSWKNELLWVNISFLLQLLCLSSVHCPHLQNKMFCLRYAKYNDLGAILDSVSHTPHVCSENEDDSEMETRSTPRSECGYWLGLCRLAAVTPRQIIPCKFLPGGGEGGGRRVGEGRY